MYNKVNIYILFFLENSMNLMLTFILFCSNFTTTIGVNYIKKIILKLIFKKIAEFLKGL